MPNQKTFQVGDKTYNFWYLPDPIDPNPASTMTFEDEENVRAITFYPYIKKDDVVFDIGASFGSYTLPALAMGAIVFSWCPEHEFKLMNKSIALKENNFKKWHTFNWGFYSKKGYFKTDTAKYFEYVYGQTIVDANKPYGHLKPGQNYGWYIQVKTIDEWMKSNKIDILKIDFFKIDVEGAELEVLKGGVETIQKFRPIIQIEHHLFKDAAMHTKVKEFLEDLDYEEKYFAPYGSVSHGLYLPD